MLDVFAQDHDENKNKAEDALLDKHICQLMEYFETVQVFVTKRPNTNDTESTARGTGNWFARYGQVVDWVKKQEKDG